MLMLLGVLFLIVGSVLWTAYGVYIERTDLQNQNAILGFAISCSVVSAFCFLNA